MNCKVLYPLYTIPRTYCVRDDWMHLNHLNARNLRMELFFIHNKSIYYQFSSAFARSKLSEMFLLFALCTIDLQKYESYAGFSKNWVKPFPKIYNTIINMKFVYNGTGVKRHFVYIRCDKWWRVWPQGWNAAYSIRSVFP